jgi:sugar-specific transcriptional regulator TrmB
MNSGVVRGSLRDSGFTQYEADAYLVLVEQGAMSAMEVAQASGVPKSRVYDVLRDLEGRGLVETYQQSNLRARALDPESVVSDLRERADQFRETADELEERWEQPDIGDYDVTLVKRQDTVIERARTFIRSAENEVQLAVSIEQFDALRPVLHEAYGRDVVVKVSLYPTADGASPPVEECDFERVVTEGCVRDLRAPFVALIDRDKTCFSPHPETGYQFGIIANNRPLSYVFQWYYLTSLWVESEVFYSERRSEPPITYVNIRQCVVDLAPLHHEGESITVSVEGYDTETGELQQFTGQVVDIVYSGVAADRVYPTLSEVSGQVTLYVDTDDEVRSIGGRYAQVEEFELRRLIVESIE